MGKFIGGDVVVIPFPYSDLSQSKRRPALVVAPLNGDDVILCQITSQLRHDDYTIQLNNSDFLNGTLPQENCSIRPNRIFTADSNIVLNHKGKISEPKLKAVRDKICEIIHK